MNRSTLVLGEDLEAARAVCKRLALPLNRARSVRNRYSLRGVTPDLILVTTGAWDRMAGGQGSGAALQVWHNVRINREHGGTSVAVMQW